MKVRPIAVADYTNVVAMINQGARQPTTVEAWLAQTPQPDLRLVVEDQQGVIVDYGTLRTPAAETNRLRLTLQGDPDRVPLPLRVALYSALETAARERGATGLDAYVADHLLSTRQFLEAHSFQLKHHYFRSQLDLATFDPEPYLVLKAKAESVGYRFHPLSELETESAQRSFYRVDIECAQDEPDYDPARPVTPYEAYAAETFLGADYDPQGLFLATKDGECAAVSGLRSTPNAEAAWTFFTGVLKPHRGSGLGAILKVLGAEYARAKGYRFVGTSNHSRNPAMLSVNQRMGFVPTGGTFDLAKSFAGE